MQDPSILAYKICQLIKDTKPTDQFSNVLYAEFLKLDNGTCEENSSKKVTAHKLCEIMNDDNLDEDFKKIAYGRLLRLI